MIYQQHILVSQARTCIADLKNMYQSSTAKKKKIRKESAFLKHLVNIHGGRDETKQFSGYFEIEIMKAYSKAFTKCLEEETYIASHKGEVLNSKSEWHQAKVKRTTTRVIQGGAEVLREQDGQANQGGGQAARQGAGRVAAAAAAGGQRAVQGEAPEQQGPRVTT